MCLERFLPLLSFCLFLLCFVLISLFSVPLCPCLVRQSLSPVPLFLCFVRQTLSPSPSPVPLFLCLVRQTLSSVRVLLCFAFSCLEILPRPSHQALSFLDLMNLNPDLELEMMYLRLGLR